VAAIEQAAWDEIEKNGPTTPDKLTTLLSSSTSFVANTMSPFRLQAMEY